MITKKYKCNLCAGPVDDETGFGLRPVNDTTFARVHVSAARIHMCLLCAKGLETLLKYQPITLPNVVALRHAESKSARD